MTSNIITKKAVVSEVLSPCGGWLKCLAPDVEQDTASRYIFKLLFTLCADVEGIAPCIELMSFAVANLPNLVSYSSKPEVVGQVKVSLG